MIFTFMVDPENGDPYVEDERIIPTTPMKVIFRSIITGRIFSHNIHKWLPLLNLRVRDGDVGLHNRSQLYKKRKEYNQYLHVLQIRTTAPVKAKATVSAFHY